MSLRLVVVVGRVVVVVGAAVVVGSTVVTAAVVAGALAAVGLPGSGSFPTPTTNDHSSTIPAGMTTTSHNSSTIPAGIRNRLRFHQGRSGGGCGGGGTPHCEGGTDAIVVSFPDRTGCPEGTGLLVRS
jgi:hypothetical protein